MVYGENPLAAAVEMMGKTALSSVTPNIIAAYAKGRDDKQRNVYTGDTLVDILTDYAKSRAPGLRETLPTVTDVTGREKENAGDPTERLLNAMLNPTGVNEYTQSDIGRPAQALL